MICIIVFYHGHDCGVCALLIAAANVVCRVKLLLALEQVFFLYKLAGALVDSDPNLHGPSHNGLECFPGYADYVFSEYCHEFSLITAFQMDAC